MTSITIPVLTFALLCLFASRSAEVIPKDNFSDADKNVTELISSKGYPVEEHEVQTKDGYILKLIRIPHGKKDVESQDKVVYLQHGVLGAASDWVLNPEDSSIAFVLADAGYDVWLGNVRGNVYSRKHISLTTKQSEFWDFSFNEMAMYDVPAMIDGILNATGKQQLYYIGHSQGTTVLFAMLAELPEYNKKIKLAIALAPVAFEGNMKGAISLLAPLTSTITAAMSLIGQHEFLPSNELMKKISSWVCNSKLNVLCQNAAFIIGGPDSEQMNSSRMGVYASHFPAGTSTFNMVHHAQNVLSGRFRKFDYGFMGNMKRYGKLSPPAYNVENITTPIALLWSDNDWLGDPDDVSILRTKLRNLISYFRVPFPKWNHFDFVLGKEAAKYLYHEIFRLLKEN